MPPKRSGKGTVLPAARVKRIMQQEDDVGKVATASPLVVAKATELFLHDMVQAIEKEARGKGTKKLSMHHVKRAVLNTPSLDFLKDLVSSIADPGDGEGGAGGENGEGSSAPKRKGRGPAKKVDGASGKAGSTKTKAAKSASPAVKEEDKPRVSIPISSLLGPSADDDFAKSEDAEEEQMDKEEATIPATGLSTMASTSRKAADDEDEDYDDE